MTIRVVLAPIVDDVSDEHALAAALAVARTFKAHVRVMHARASPSAAMFAGGPVGAAMTGEILEIFERDATERAGRARARYDAWRTAAKLTEATAPSDYAGVSVSWSEFEGSFDATIARQGRVSDLIVLGARTEGGDGSTLGLSFEGALFDSGRPVLLTPSPSADAFMGTAMIAWNGSAEAAAAVGAALPVLAQAKRIHVFAAAERGEEPRLPTDLIDYLGWHGIAATVRTVAASPANVGAELLREAEQVGAGLIVMGAYTHGRLRQLIFGGATSHVLRHSTIPLLMAH
jgi:nucleotide-binding universal stress UspA family protein